MGRITHDDQRELAAADELLHRLRHDLSDFYDWNDEVPIDEMLRSDAFAALTLGDLRRMARALEMLREQLEESVEEAGGALTTTVGRA